jgi:ribosomal protein S4
MSIDPRNCFNLTVKKDLDIKALNINQIEWKSKTLGKLYILGDVTTSHFMKIFRECHKNIFRTFEKFETRLDNILFRSHFATSIFQARNLISRRIVAVNGKTNSVSSTYLSEGDMITICPDYWKNLYKEADNPFRKMWGFIPTYLDVNFGSCSAVLIRNPKYIEIPVPYNKKLINHMGNYYSRR